MANRLDALEMPLGDCEICEKSGLKVAHIIQWDRFLNRHSGMGYKVCGDCVKNLLKQLQEIFAPTVAIPAPVAKEEPLSDDTDWSRVDFSKRGFHSPLGD